MKTKRFFETMKAGAFVLSATVVAFMMGACNNPNPEDPKEGGDAVELTLDPTSVSLSVGETATANITSGNGGYVAISADESIAVATIDGTVVTVKGVKAGSTVITIRDAEKKAKPLSVTVSATGVNNIRTDVLYNIQSTSAEECWQQDQWGNSWDHYQGPKLFENTPICTKRDFDNNAMNASSYKIDSSVKDFFDLMDDDNVFVCSGIGYNGATEYGHAAIALLLTNEDDPAHPGMKKMQIITTNLGAYLGWEDGKYTSTPGSAYYNPEDGSFTLINCKGYLAWEGGNKPFLFTADRTYTPVK